MEYDTVRHTIEQSIGWAIEKDFEAMYRLWADDMFHFWLFSGSKVVDSIALKNTLKDGRILISGVRDLSSKICG